MAYITSEDKIRAEAIRDIETLWPPDSTGPGRDDVLHVLAKHWRKLGTYLLLDIRARQIERDHNGD